MSLNSPEEILTLLLQSTVEDLDIPEALALRAIGEYQSVGKFLADRYDDLGEPEALIYPQGSFRIGTVVRPLGRDDYDIDLVLRLGFAKENISQAALKARSGEDLTAYRESLENSHAPGMEEGKRCWTLRYPAARFHMDLLPGIPNPEAAPHGILITDRELQRWQSSNPIGYADWFRSQMLDDLVRFAKEAKTEVEEVEDWRAVSMLQRAVQVLKRHRDLYFEANPEDAPPSILVSTLAARSYRSGLALYSTVRVMAQEMPFYIEHDNGKFVVPNPVQPDENFADRWGKHPHRKVMFDAWLTALQRDLDDAGGGGGLDRVVERLGEAFGPEPVRKAAEKLGIATRETRESGRLRMAVGSGILGTSHGTRVRPHGFYGTS